MGEITLDIPRDRKGEFEPQIVKKKQTDISNIEDQVLSMYAKGMTQLSTYFKYPSEIRKLIYATNSIENFNRQLRKVTKSKTIFPTDDALFKMLYLAMMDATKKWTGKSWDWDLT